MAVDQSLMRLTERASSRASSLPQGDGGSRDVEGIAEHSVGASLLAMAVGQTLVMLTERGSSRASSLPQKDGGGWNKKYPL
ncbi:hypothetical protein SAMN03159488_02922 [Pseudomonas sp. NFIX10]|nr:hypothetical protein SAMN03159488_02922 [Pseudomonas sp. NFIX10]